MTITRRMSIACSTLPEVLPSPLMRRAQSSRSDGVEHAWQRSEPSDQFELAWLRRQATASCFLQRRAGLAQAGRAIDDEIDR